MLTCNRIIFSITKLGGLFLKFYILKGETFIFTYPDEERQNEVQLFERKEDVEWAMNILQPLFSEKLVIEELEIQDTIN